MMGEGDQLESNEGEDVFTPNPTHLDGVSDLSMLLYLGEKNILHNLKCRFTAAEKKPYTSISRIIIAINPYERLSLYGRAMIQRYDHTDGQLATAEPHVYRAAAMAYHDMLRKHSDQSIIVCGESGAGKSESSKFMMQFLAYTAVKKAATDRRSTCDSMVEQQVLAAAPILEAFGNAKTVLNDNSSRFGKFTKLLFCGDRLSPDFGRVVGSSLETYLLEKSRVVFQESGERNFHCFYQLVHGADDTMKDRLEIEEFTHFRYINQGGDPSVSLPGICDGSRFKELCLSMSLMRIDVEAQQTIFSLLAGILHLGDIDFEENEKSFADVVHPFLGSVGVAANLFGLEKDELNHRLTNQSVTVVGEVIISHLSVENAYKNRDSMAKSIYHGIFTWLCRRINAELFSDDEGETDDQLFIGILDIFGFETFDLNSFEQICINFANERLQGYFNEYIIKSEQELYLSEGILWTPLKVPDNREILSLFTDSTSGIYSLLDTTCVMPKGTPEIYVRSLMDHHRRSKIISQERAAAKRKSGQSFARAQKGSKQFIGFSVNHYAGAVIYDCQNFLLKNTEKIHADTAKLFHRSQNTLVSQILDTKSAVASGRRRGKARSIGSQFKSQLDVLMETLYQTTPFFVRCINPNGRKSPTHFDSEYVLSQLRCGGVIEALRVIKLGYPTRISYSSIDEQFGTTVQHPRLAGFSGRQFTEAILVAFGLNSQNYEMGLTKVFFKPNKAEILDEIVAWGSRPLSEEHLQRITEWVVRKRWQRVCGLLKACVYLLKKYNGVKAEARFRSAAQTIVIYNRTFKASLERVRIRKRRAEEEKRRAEEEKRRAEEEARLLAEQRSVSEEEKKRKKKQAEVLRFEKERARLRELADKRRKEAEKKKEEKEEEGELEVERAPEIVDEKDTQMAEILRPSRHRERLSGHAVEDGKSRQKRKILWMKQKMEEELEIELHLLEEIERKEAAELRRLEEMEEEHMLVRGPSTLKRQTKFLEMGRVGELFLRHRKRRNIPGKKAAKAQERFIKILMERGAPHSIAWGSGERFILMKDISCVSSGHVSPVFKNSKSDASLCFSIIASRKTLDLEADTKEKADMWVSGLRVMLGHSDAQALKISIQIKNGETLLAPPPKKSVRRSSVLDQRQLFEMNVSSVFRDLLEEGQEIPKNFEDSYSTENLFKRCTEENVSWQNWSEWIRLEILKDMIGFIEYEQNNRTLSLSKKSKNSSGKTLKQGVTRLFTRKKKTSSKGNQGSESKQSELSP
eukprot:458181_1